MLSSLLRQRDKSGDTVTLVLAAGQEPLISMQCSDEVGITEPSVYFPRHLSEIRDQWISDCWGQSPIDSYYMGKRPSPELRFERNWMVAGTVVEAIAAVFCWLPLGSIYEHRKIGSAPWGRASL
jgi:hypothetical protein